MVTVCEKADVSFLLESTSSVGLSNWDTYLMPFVRGVIERLPVAPSVMRVSAVKFDQDGTVEWPLTRFTSVADVQRNGDITFGGACK